jgi:L-malate glycosyltransferase
MTRNFQKDRLGYQRIVNILFIIQSLDHGGTEKQLVQLIQGLKDSCFRPHLCTLKSSNGFFDDLEIPKINLNLCSFCHPFHLRKKMAFLSAFIRSYKIQIVQTFFQDPFLLATILKPFHKFKLIGSFRDLGFWRTSSSVLKMRLAYPSFDKFIANSKAVKEFFFLTDRLPPDSIEVIHNGINVVDESLIENGQHNNPPRNVVGIVANCNRSVKRVDDFIRVAALVHRQKPEVQFVLVGDGPLRPELERLSSSLHLDGNIRFAGQIPEPLNLVRTFQIGVITSETEGFSNAIMEYMACGVPVVATNTGGNAELVIDGENGYLVPVGDLTQMAERILHLLGNEIQRKKIQKINRNRISNHFSLEKMIEEHKFFYHRIMES